MLVFKKCVLSDFFFLIKPVEQIGVVIFGFQKLICYIYISSKFPVYGSFLLINSQV